MNTQWKRNRLLNRTDWVFHTRVPTKCHGLREYFNLLAIAKKPFDNTLMTWFCELELYDFF